MVSILRHTHLTAGTGYRYLLLLAPLVLVGIPLACGVAIGAAGWAAGLPPVEYASGFLLEVSSTLPWAVLSVAVMAIVLGSIAGFAVSCASWSRTKSLVLTAVLRAVSRIGSFLVPVQADCRDISNPGVAAPGCPELSTPRLRAAPTAAALAGALPLLN